MAPTLYKLIIRDDTAVPQTELVSFLALSYVKRVNAPGLLVFSVSGNHPLVTTIQKNWFVEVHYKPAGGNWTLDFTGIVRKIRWEWKGAPYVTITCPGIIDILRWRIVAWYANTASRSKFTAAKAETIMKTLVSTNCGAAATTSNGRIRDGSLGIVNQVDGAAGNTIDWYCAFANVLDTLQKVANVGGGDFDLVITSSPSLEFRWYTGQRGTDRSATVKFSMELGNMAEPVFEDDHIDEKTVALVGGQGTDALRDVSTATGSTYVAASNDTEMFLEATDIEKGNTTALTTRGEQKLYQTQTRPTFDFRVIQTPTSRYGVEYFVGDLTAAINPYNGTSYTEKVMAAYVVIGSDGNPKVDVEVQLQ